MGCLSKKGSIQAPVHPHTRLRVAVAVARRILSGLHHRNQFVPLDAVFDELAPVDRSGLCGPLHPASPTSCASRSRGTSVVFRRPLHGHVHVSVQHDHWIKIRRCRPVTVAQSVWVCLVAFSSQYSYITVHIVDMRTTSFVIIISYSYTSNKIM